MDSFNFIHTIFYFIVAISILVSFHEFGHFWVARKMGVRVLKFSVGFGKTIWRYQKHPKATEYVLAVIPLGGYVKMLDERIEPVFAADLPYAFNRQSLLARVAIVLAGPLFNFMLAILLYWLVLTIGDIGIKPIIDTPRPNSIAAQAGFVVGEEIIAIDGKKTSTWSEVMITLFAATIDNKRQLMVDVRDLSGQKNSRILAFSEPLAKDQEVFYQRLGLNLWNPIIKPIIGTVFDGGAAQASGLQTNDKIISVGDESIESWIQWVNIIKKSAGRALDVVIERDGTQFPLSLIPARVVTEQGVVQGKVGVAVALPEDIIKTMQVKYSLPPWQALISACAKTYQYSIATLKMMGHILIGNASVDNLSGPISIAKYAGQTADLGWVHFLKFLAAISISLGVLNLLPIPMLDGGHLLLFLIEAIKGSPVSEKIQLLFQQVGISLLVSLMLLVMFLDIERLFS